MDTMKKRQRSPSFREQMRASMDALRAIITSGHSPDGNGRLSVRTVDVVEPSDYASRDIRLTRLGLMLSQALFALLLVVSPSLVLAW